MNHDRLLAALCDALGGTGCSRIDAGRAPLRRLERCTECAAARALLLPRTPSQVGLALRLCTKASQPVVVQGGLTGLAGGANPQAGELALSLARLDAIEDFDELGGTVVVQAGVTLQRLQEAAAERGWFFPVDLGARGSCQLGGNAATNAGGNRVLRFGMVRQSVLGLEVALADGRLLNMLDRMIKLLSGPFAEAAQLEAVEHLVYAEVEAVQGSISTEHGIGVVKRPFLHHSRDADQLDVMRRLKRCLDPADILGAGRVVAAGG